jgi:D-3-phosphoglycerate dehydrogenase / 2-oxoglutarate reductase
VIEKKCLFSAPFDFMPDVQQKYLAFMPTVFQEIWYPDELKPNEEVAAWVMNPGQRFIIDEVILEKLPNLSLLVTPSTGRNHIDSAACERRNIPVFSLLDDREGLNTISSSAEFSFLLLLNTLRRVDIAVQEVSARHWRQNEDRMRGNELQDKKVGLVGFGRIGHRLARYCIAFKASVVYFDPYVKDEAYSSVERLEDIFSECDVVCICCTLTPETIGMINHTLLSHLRTGACLVNTSRGEVVNEDDMLAFLQERPDVRVGLDVLAGEVMNEQNQSPLMMIHDKGQIVITPHIAGATIESQSKAALVALGLMQRYLLRK